MRTILLPILEEVEEEATPLNVKTEERVGNAVWTTATTAHAIPLTFVTFLSRIHHPCSDQASRIEESENNSTSMYLNTDCYKNTSIYATKSQGRMKFLADALFNQRARLCAPADFSRTRSTSGASAALAAGISSLFVPSFLADVVSPLNPI